jgi:N-methylhydantoinase A
VLCALGDATTAVRDESSRTYIRKFSETSAEDIAGQLRALSQDAAKSLAHEKVPASEMEFSYQVDVRYHGQGLRLTVDVDLPRLEKTGLDAIRKPFDEEHTRLFTFALPLQHEFVALRAAVQGKGVLIERRVIQKGDARATAAVVGKQKAYMDGRDVTALVYDRARLKAGNRVPGPAIVMEMDSTTVVLPRHHGRVDAYGNILIYPDKHSASKKKATAARPARAVSRLKRVVRKVTRKAK